MATETAIKKGHPIYFGVLILFSIVLMSISAFLVDRYNSDDSFPSEGVSNTVRYILCAWCLLYAVKILTVTRHSLFTMDYSDCLRLSRWIPRCSNGFWRCSIERCVTVSLSSIHSPHLTTSASFGSFSPSVFGLQVLLRSLLSLVAVSAANSQTTLIVTTSTPFWVSRGLTLVSCPLENFMSHPLNTLKVLIFLAMIVIIVISVRSRSSSGPISA